MLPRGLSVKKSILALILLFYIQPTFATPPILQSIFDEMESNNNEIALSQLDKQFSEQSLRGARSRLWPSLSLVAAANKNDDGALPPGGTNFSSGASSPSGSLGAASNSSISQVNSTSGYTNQLSLSYFIFSQFAISQNIERAKLSLMSSELNIQQTLEAKKSQLLQLILEWQFLKDVEPKLIKAKEQVQKVKSHTNKQASFLYSTSDHMQMREKYAQLDYQITRVQEGLLLTESALLSLLPSLTSERLAQLPAIVVNYDLPNPQQIEEKYTAQSRNSKKSQIDIDSAKAYLKSAEWSQPWVPSIYLSASYSNSGTYQGDVTNGSSASLMFNFNVFDGFYSHARQQQARIAVRMTEEKKQVEAQKRILYLKHQRMKAKIANADYRLKEAIANKKKLRMQDVQKKIKQGIATQLELSAGTMNYLNAKMEALNALKEYQQALLNIAIELNEWEKVEINDIKKI